MIFIEKCASILLSALVPMKLLKIFELGEGFKKKEKKDREFSLRGGGPSDLGSVSLFFFYNPPSKIRPGGTEAQQGYRIV